MKLKAYAKTNLFLAVTAKREDGYHELDMLNSSISLFDEITLEKSEEISCEGIEYENNTAIKAAEAFIRRYKTGGVKITVKKNIPESGGLGGSSADAAAVIYGMAKLYKKTLMVHDIENFSAVGADVPFMINGGLAHVSGSGEKVKKLPFDLDLHGVVIKSDIGCNAGDVYRKYDETGAFSDKNSEAIRKAAQNLGAFKEAKRLGMTEDDPMGLREKLMEYDLYDHTFNALQEAATEIAPEIAEILTKLADFKPKASLVSGSGSSVIAFFTPKKAKEVEAALRPIYPFVSTFNTMPHGIEIIEE